MSRQTPFTLTWGNRIFKMVRTRLICEPSSLKEAALNSRIQHACGLATNRQALRFAIAAGLLAVVAWQVHRAAMAQPASSPPATVKMTVDYGDGVQKSFVRLPWKAEMTALDALRLADKHPRGIDAKWRGSGANTFLTQIDDLANEGLGANDRNWLVYVNDELIDRSIGVFPLRKSARITWRYVTAEEAEF